MEQKQVLDNLYALRAGLSVISQQYDKAQAIEDECDKKLLQNADELDKSFACHSFYTDHTSGLRNFKELQNLRKRYGYIDGYQQKIEAGEIQPDETVKATKSWYAKINENNAKAISAYAHWIACDESTELFQINLERAQNYKDAAVGGCDSHTDGFSYKSEAKREKILSIVFFSIAAVLAIIIAVGFATMTSFKSEIGIAVFLIIAFTIFLILGIVYICKAKKDKLKHDIAVQDKDIELRQAAEMLERLPQVRENARAILNEKDKKIAPVKENSNSFYMALVKQFSSLLDERDWKNLDLVIYELETRRADTVKEALQLVDRELQTERIQQTIVQATEQICYEIRRGFAEMRETIIECSRVISAQLSAVSLQLADIGGQLNELCDSVNMGNALQAKANVTSAQLLSDVHAIRFYS